MPRGVLCDLIDCRFNQGGECDNDEIDLDSTATCQTYEPRGGVNADRG